MHRRMLTVVLLPALVLASVLVAGCVRDSNNQATPVDASAGEATSSTTEQFGERDPVRERGFEEVACSTLVVVYVFDTGDGLNQSDIGSLIGTLSERADGELRRFGTELADASTEAAQRSVLGDVLNWCEDQGYDVSLVVPD